MEINTENYLISKDLGKEVYRLCNKLTRIDRELFGDTLIKFSLNITYLTKEGKPHYTPLSKLESTLIAMQELGNGKVPVKNFSNILKLIGLLCE